MKLKLLFDENWGKPIVGAIAGLLRFRPYETEVAHIIDYVGTSGMRDAEWVQRLRSDAGWIVITTDRGRRGAERLPRICAEERVTHVLVSGTIHSFKQFQKATIFFKVWDRLEEAAKAGAGRRYLIRLSGDRHRTPIWTEKPIKTQRPIKLPDASKG